MSNSLLIKQMQFSENVGKLIQFAYSIGIGLSFGEVYRTKEQQEIYFKSGRSKTMNSRHLQKLAVDFNMFDLRSGGRMLFDYGITSKQYKEDLNRAKELGDYWVMLNVDNVWGADWDNDKNYDEHSFKDPYHFEMKP